jgi:hypothetical protein
MFIRLKGDDLTVIKNCDAGGGSWLAGKKQQAKEQCQSVIQFHGLINLMCKF